MQTNRYAFTLIELSIVLVIIGLIIGGVLLGQDLIKAAETRAQVSQFEKFKTALNVFNLKYGALPGDISEPNASAFGFVARGAYAGQGDGNGVLEGVTANSAAANSGSRVSMGETAVFFVDLSTANMIEGAFSTATNTVVVTSIAAASLPSYYPSAKLGNNFLYTFSYNGINQLSVASLLNIGAGCNGCATSYTAMTVASAYDIDQKIDDGKPQSGRILAWYLTGGGVRWAAGSGGYQNGVCGAAAGAACTAGALPTTAATAQSATTCYDNNNTAGAEMQYSLARASSVNCAISYRF